jgi:ATP-dependent Clp protease ATP-binding subunit ClpC
MTDRDRDPSQDVLFDRGGALRTDLFTTDAWTLLTRCQSWLEQIGRNTYLPLDLLLVAVRDGHPELVRAMASATGLPENAEQVGQAIADLAARIERPQAPPPRLDAAHFSLGFVSVLTDALAWAHEVGRSTIEASDILRALRWRAEMQESASLRWAMQQLAQPNDVRQLFHDDGTLLPHRVPPRFRQILQRAAQLSARAGMPYLGTPQVVAAALEEPSSLLSRACSRADVPSIRVHEDLLFAVSGGGPPVPEFELRAQTFTPRLVRILVQAFRLARSNGGRIEEQYFLEPFLHDGGVALSVIRKHHLEEPVRAEVRSAHAAQRERSGSRPTELELESGPLVEEPAGELSTTPTLDALGRDLTALARDGRLAPVLGRERELQRVINILLRTEQRNPLLTGEAGVGKTAIAAALAHRIAAGTVPARLADVRIVEVSGASLLGGTSYRGELEARIKSLLREASDRVILFIDEAHAVFAPRTGAGQPAEIPNHFKSALASDALAVIAATTEDEYHRWIEQDPALRRRFERIDVPELSPAHTRDILAHLAPTYERTWDVTVTPEAVDAAVDLSVRFLPEQSLPDKAKKLLMDATIAVSSELAASGDPGRSPEHACDTPSRRAVRRQDVARRIAEKTGIPLDRIETGARGWWDGLEQRLLLHVVGQLGPVRQASRFLLTGRLQSAGRPGPIAVFVFLGPTGVGKSDLARGLALEIFGSDKALLRLDMGDFAEPHSLSRLIGTPPGYVGYEDEDALVAPLRRRPGRVVLLQDFDRAHPRVQDRFVRLFADGSVADTRGLTADASHAIFILTIDRAIDPRGAIGFGPSADETPPLRQLDRTLDDRLRGVRFETVLFEGLHDGDRTLGPRLLEDRIARFTTWLENEYGITLELDSDLRAELETRIAACRDPRDIERIFHELIVDPVSLRMLDGTTPSRLRIPARTPGASEPLRA